MAESYEVKSLQERLHTLQKQREELHKLLSQAILMLQNVNLDEQAEIIQNAIDWLPEIP
jgi:hypothetical protein